MNSMPIPLYGQRLSDGHIYGDMSINPHPVDHMNGGGVSYRLDSHTPMMLYHNPTHKVYDVAASIQHAAAQALIPQPTPIMAAKNYIQSLMSALYADMRQYGAWLIAMLIMTLMMIGQNSIATTEINALQYQNQARAQVIAQQRQEAADLQLAADRDKAALARQLSEQANQTSFLQTRVMALAQTQELMTQQLRTQNALLIAALQAQIPPSQKAARKALRIKTEPPSAPISDSP
jgi:hypothetical protein